MGKSERAELRYGRTFVAKHQFSVLALDGGGVRGVLTAGILERIEKHLQQQCGDKKQLGERFDLIAGTSVGGIIALGLASGRSAADMHRVLRDNVAKIFPHPHDWVRRFSSLFRAKYSNWELAKVLCQELNQEPNKELSPDWFTCMELRRKTSPVGVEDASAGELKTMRDLERRVLVTSVSAWDGKPRFHKTDHLGRNDARGNETLVGVGLATAAAPTFFPQVGIGDGLRHSDGLVDGGVVCNNPSLVAWIEAQLIIKALASALDEEHALRAPVKDFFVPPDDKLGKPDFAVKPGKIKVLSVGTGKQCDPSYSAKGRERKSRGKIGWMGSLWDLILDSQAQLVDEQMKFLLGGDYVRINPLMRYTAAMDDSRAVSRLSNLMDLNGDDLAKLERLFPSDTCGQEGDK